MYEKSGNNFPAIIYSILIEDNGEFFCSFSRGGVLGGRGRGVGKEEEGKKKVKMSGEEQKGSVRRRVSLTSSVIVTGPRGTVTDPCIGDDRPDPTP